MKQTWSDELRLFLASYILGGFIVGGIGGWFVYLHWPHKWLGIIFAVILVTVFLEWYFNIWAKVRFDMYVQTTGKSKITYVRIGSDNFLVPIGQELVIRQSDSEPGKLEVFTGPVGQ
jgi:hypothetical protein